MLPALPHIDLMELNFVTVIVRLTLTTICSSIVGLNRTYKRHAAGFRTYVLVCLGACVAMMSGEFMYLHLGSGDASRVGAQVISGIGFLGAGSIIISGSYHIRGLTTAAGIWATATMGLAFGIGFYFGGLALCAFIFMALSGFDRLQHIYQNDSKYIDLYVVLDGYQSMRDFFDEMHARDWKIRTFTPSTEGRNGEIALAMSIRMDGKKDHEEIVKEARLLRGVILLEEVHE